MRGAVRSRGAKRLTARSAPVSAHTLKSFARVLNGAVLNRASLKRRASAANLPLSAARVAVAQDQQIHFFAGRAAVADRDGFCGGRRRSRMMSVDAGSTSNVHTTENALRSSRFRTRTRTGFSGSGKRSDSPNPRLSVCASSVVCHSPKIVLKPRE